MLSLVTVAGTGLVLLFVWFRYWRHDTAATGSSFRAGRIKRDEAVVSDDELDASRRTKLPPFGRRNERAIAAKR